MTATAKLSKGDAALFDSDLIDLSDCSILQISIGLTEFDRAAEGLSHRFDSWPESVRRHVEKELAQWTARHRDRVIKLVSSGIGNGFAVLILHHAKKVEG